MDESNGTSSWTSKGNTWASSVIHRVRQAAKVVARKPTDAPLTHLLAIIVLILPPILYIITFALTMQVMNTPDFVAADRLTPEDFENPDASGIPLNRSAHASPFYQCIQYVGNATDPFYYREKCVRRYAFGKAGLASCEQLNFGKNVKICEKITTTAELYLAAAVLIGAAFLGGLLHAYIAAWIAPSNAGYTNVEDRQQRNDEVSQDIVAVGDAIGSFTSLLALGAVMCLIMAQHLGYASMVIESSRDIMGRIDGQSRWAMSKGLFQYTSAAYGLAFGGAFIALTRCGLGR